MRASLSPSASCTTASGFPLSGSALKTLTWQNRDVRMSLSRSALLAQFGCLGAYALLLLAQLGRELGAEVLGLEHLADLDLGLGAGHRVGAALDPLDRLFLRLHLPEPEAGDQLLRLGERAVGDNAPLAREAHARALAARLQAFAREHDAGLDQLLVVLAHRGEQLLARHLAGFGILACLDNDHETH